MKRLVSLAALTLTLLACRSTLQTTQRFKSSRITVTTTGSGSDVVLISGAGTKASDVWAGTIAAVPGHRYHVVQIAGFGGFPSEGNGAEGPVVGPIAQEIERYIREQKLNRPAVIGFSMGGSLAMNIAASQPELISRMLIVDMVPFMGAFIVPPGQPLTVDSARPVAEKRLAFSLAQTPESYRTLSTLTIAAMVKRESERQRVAEASVASDAKVLARSMYDLFTLDQRQDIAAFRGPVTVLYVQSPLIPLSPEQLDSAYRTAFAALPQAKLRRIDDSYHFVMLDQPERFADEVRTFLQ